MHFERGTRLGLLPLPLHDIHVSRVSAFVPACCLCHCRVPCASVIKGPSECDVSGCKYIRAHSICLLRERPDMMSASEGEEGGHGNAYVVREVV